MVGRQRNESFPMGAQACAGKSGYEAMERGFHDENIMFRTVGDSIAVTPPLIVSEAQIDEIFNKVAKVIGALSRPARLPAAVAAAPSRTALRRCRGGVGD